MPTKQRLNRLRGTLENQGINAFLISRPTNVEYICGFTGSSGWLLTTLKEAFLFTDSRYHEQAAEEAPWVKIIRVPSYFEEGMLEKVTADIIVQQIIEEDIQELAFESNCLSFNQYSNLVRRLPFITFKPILHVIEEQRVIKSGEEIELMKKAASLGDEIFAQLKSVLKSGMTELEAAREFRIKLQQVGAVSESFPAIIASGHRGSMPHGAPTDKVIRENDLIVIDFGVRWQGYCSDMTRTVILGNNVDPEKEERYNLVRKAQESAISAVRPGVKSGDLDKIARDIIKEAGYGDYFKHALGHGIGKDVHENPRVKQDSTCELRPGMVITIEPGIYIEKWGGIRIEDMVLVTPDGCEVLTKAEKSIKF